MLVFPPKRVTFSFQLVIFYMNFVLVFFFLLVVAVTFSFLAVSLTSLGAVDKNKKISVRTDESHKQGVHSKTIEKKLLLFLRFLIVSLYLLI